MWYGALWGRRVLSSMHAAGRSGVGVDIRSDLYSFGVTFWQMLTGKLPFHGTPAEVMYHHQHAPLPLEQLINVPQPVVILLVLLLEKDPAGAFRTRPSF